MKSVQLQDGFGIDRLQMVEVAEPAPGPGQVLLTMKAWSLNYRDLMVVRGVYNPKMKLPMTPISDGVGVVTAVGPGATRVQVGDRVACSFFQGWIEGDLTDAKSRTALGGGGQGLLAEQVVVSEVGVVPVPSHLSDAQAASLPCAAVTAWHALIVQGGLKAGDTVLIQGTGGVSLFALQFAVMHGARALITSSSDAKLEKALAMGASAGINYKTHPEWETKIRELTDGVGCDHVVEVGGPGTLGKSLKAVRSGGRIYLIGVLAGAGEINPLPILMKNVRLQGIFVGSRAMFEEMNRAITLHQMKPTIDQVFRFDEIQAALTYLESARHFGKICLTT